MEKEGMVRCTECPVTFANLRNLKRHQNQKHKDDVNMSKCPIGGCEVFSFRMEYLASHLHISHGENSRGSKNNSQKNSCRGEETLRN